MNYPAQVGLDFFIFVVSCRNMEEPLNVILG